MLFDSQLAGFMCAFIYVLSASLLPYSRNWSSLNILLSVKLILLIPMAPPDYLSLDPDELEEHHKYMLKTGLGEEKFLESEWNCMGMKLKAFLSFDGRGEPRVQETTESESKAMRIIRVLCCQIILPNSKRGASSSNANDPTERRPGIKGTELLPPAAAGLQAAICEKRRQKKEKEDDEAYYRHHKVERYDWDQYDPDASDDDVDVWKVKPLSEPDASSVASYEPCSPSDDGSSIGEPVLPSDFGASTLSFGASLLTGPEQPPLPAICARTVPPVLLNHSLDEQVVGDSVGVSRETRRRKAPTPDEDRTPDTRSVDSPKLVEVPGENTPLASYSKSRDDVSRSSSSSSSSSVTSANSRASTIQPGSSHRSTGQASVITVIKSGTPEPRVGLSRSPSYQKARLTTESPVIRSREEDPLPEVKTRPPTTARPRHHARRRSLQMPMASPRIGERSRPPLSGSAYGGSRNYCGCDAVDCRECRETTTPEKYFPFEHHGALLPKRDSGRHSPYYT